MRTGGDGVLYFRRSASKCQRPALQTVLLPNSRQSASSCCCTAHNLESSRSPLIKELLIVLLDFCFPVHHLESGQKLDKSRGFRELCRDPDGIFLVVQFAALRNDGCGRRLKVLAYYSAAQGLAERSDCDRNDESRSCLAEIMLNRLQVINHKEGY
jgi:hypothetical protein